MRTYIAISILALVAASALFLPTVSLGATAATEDSSSSIAYDIQFRETNGLRADLSYVQGSEEDHETFSNSDWAVPLTEAEARGLAERVAARPLMNDAIRYAESQDDFAGMRIDPQRGGLPEFWFTRDLALHSSDIAALLPATQNFMLSLAAVSMIELTQTMSAIGNDFAELAQLGVPAETVFVDPAANDVVVGLAKPADGALTTLQERYGPHISIDVTGTIQRDACVDRYQCGNPQNGMDWKGGLWIHPSAYSDASWCTSSFLARDNGNLVMITAGHCIAEKGGPGSGHHWDHHGLTIGHAVSESYTAANTVADVGIIGVADPYNPVAYNGSLDSDTHWHCAGSCFTGIRYFFSVAHDVDQQNGDLVCRFGATSGYWCGNIINHDVGKYVDSVWIRHSVTIDVDAMPGDSGAPYFLASTVYGIHTDSTNADPPGGTAWYSPMDRIHEQTGVNVCLSYSC